MQGKYPSHCTITLAPLFVFSFYHFGHYVSWGYFVWVYFIWCSLGLLNLCLWNFRLWVTLQRSERFSVIISSASQFFFFPLTLLLVFLWCEDYSCCYFLSQILHSLPFVYRPIVISFLVMTKSFVFSITHMALCMLNSVAVSGYCIFNSFKSICMGLFDTLDQFLFQLAELFFQWMTILFPWPLHRALL